MVLSPSCLADYCKRVLDFFPVNNFVNRMNKMVILSWTILPYFKQINDFFHSYNS